MRAGREETEGVVPGGGDVFLLGGGDGGGESSLSVPNRAYCDAAVVSL